MPHIKLTGMTKDGILPISTGLIDQLEALLECPRDYFTIELTNEVYVCDGKVVAPPFKVVVEWFDRGQQVQDQAARIITDTLKSAGYSPLDIYFTHLSTSCYYENGEHF